MFDIGFTEMILVAVVALIVLGPERLPRVARQAGEWLGKLRRYVDDVKSDINRQMELEELRRIHSEVTTAAESLQKSMQSVVSDASKDLAEINATLGAVAGDSAASGAEDMRTDWDRIYSLRQTRNRIKDRRLERERALGIKRPKRPLHR